MTLAPLLLAAAVSAPPQSTETGAALLRQLSEGVAATEVGQWVTYAAKAGGGTIGYWRVAVVGQEKDRLGRDAYWIEIEVGRDARLSAPLAQMRLLVARASGFQASGITRVFIGQAADRPVEVESGSLQAVKLTHPTEGRSSLNRARVGQEASLMTEAGTVTALPLEIADRGVLLQRMWISRDVPVLHLAKLEMPAIGHALEVRDYGAGAQPRMILPDPNSPKIRLDPSRAGEVP